MSAAVSFKTPTARAGVRPSLSLVPNLRSLSKTSARPGVAFFGMLALGLVAIAILNLLLNLATSSGVYQLAGLKAQQSRLALDTQILKQQVDSLSSNQNLASAAEAMGMIANSNPVFIDVNNQKVYGEPAAASINNGKRVSGNLVANSLWTTRSHANQIRSALAAEQAKATGSVASTSVATDSTATASSTKPAATSGSWTNAEQGYVGGAKSSTAQVGLAGSGIPAAVSH